jgi:hypothetical protein
MKVTTAFGASCRDRIPVVWVIKSAAKALKRSPSMAGTDMVFLLLYAGRYAGAPRHHIGAAPVCKKATAPPIGRAAVTASKFE